MNTSKFLGGIKAIEKKIHQMVGENPERMNFSSLVQQLVENDKLESKTAVELRELWDVRNIITSSRTEDGTISDDIQNLLIKVMSDLNLQ